MKIRYFLKKIAFPKSQNEDLKRREFILNILLLCSIVLLTAASAISAIDLISGNPIDRTNNALPLIDVFAVLFIFLVLYFFSRAGFFIYASYALIGIYFSMSIYMVYKWGIEVPAGLIFLILTIILSGMLIGTRFAFLMTFASSAGINVINYFQMSDIIHPDFYWKRRETMGMLEPIMMSIAFFIIAAVSWLSNREIEKSLVRARKSEAELKKERDFLEIKVEKRTKELKDAQIEKMAQFSRFAEFGRLSSGLFHDLINPLTAVSLNMEKIKGGQASGEGVDETKSHLEKAIQATKKMEEFILAVRKQMSNEESKIYFSPEDEIRQIINILSHKALKADVKINFSASCRIMTYGDAVKFNQVVANLAANAIDACEDEDMNDSSDGKKTKEAAIVLTEENGIIIMTVKDNGKGIPKEHINKIFDPFFTTKGFCRGIGIGLSLTKTIIEKDFRGTIGVESAEGEGAKFTIKFPKKGKV